MVALPYHPGNMRGYSSRSVVYMCLTRFSSSKPIEAMAFSFKAILRFLCRHFKHLKETVIGSICNSEKSFLMALVVFC